MTADNVHYVKLLLRQWRPCSGGFPSPRRAAAPATLGASLGELWDRAMGSSDGWGRCPCLGRSSRPPRVRRRTGLIGRRAPSCAYTPPPGIYVTVTQCPCPDGRERQPVAPRSQARSRSAAGPGGRSSTIDTQIADRAPPGWAANDRPRCGRPRGRLHGASGPPPLIRRHRRGPGQPEGIGQRSQLPTARPTPAPRPLARSPNSVGRMISIAGRSLLFGLRGGVDR